MDTFGLIALVILVITIFAGRFFNERGNRSLDEQGRNDIISIFKGFRLKFLLAIVVLMLSFFLCVKLFPHNYRDISFIYFGLLAVYMILTNAVTYRKMKALDLPAEYTRNFIAGKAVMYTGLGIFILYAVLHSL